MNQWNIRSITKIYRDETTGWVAFCKTNVVFKLDQQPIGLLCYDCSPKTMKKNNKK